MNSLTDHRRHPNSYFHLHPLHAIYSLLMGALLAALAVLALVVSAK